jgi:hypothetical protein
MAQSSRFVWVVGGTCLAASVLTLGRPRDDPPPAPEWSGALPRAIDPLRRTGDALDDRIAAMGRKMELKQAVLDDLIAGRRTLADAVARVREIEDRYPEFADHLRSYLIEQYPGRGFDECLARNLLQKASYALQYTPDQARAVMARLEAELDAYVRTLR